MQSLDKARNLIIEKYSNNHKSRLEHIIGVVEMASYLAKIYGIDENKAMIAAYMHDYAKYDDFEIEKTKLSTNDIEECEKYPFLYHAYLSAWAYKEYIGDDDEIYLAIRNHVFGRTNMTKLEEIIMIADYTEKNRTYPSCIECRKILLDGNLNLAIYKSLMYMVKFVKDSNSIPHPEQLKVLDEYKRKVKNMILEEIIIENLGKVKAKDILVYDTKERSPFYEKMILCSVDSERQATSAVSYIAEEAEKNAFKIRSVEGQNTSWVLIDCYNIIVSIFTREEREHFAIEKIYMDVPCKEIKDKE
ncbi:MAG: bis(5'-nucleosyl)-tetraphosphatase (symmetrical) YqeK [Anaeroplasma sp.]